MLEFTIQAGKLQEACRLAAKVIPARTNNHLYYCILIKSDKESGLVLSSTDGMKSVVTRIEAPVKGEGSLALPAKKFGEVIRVFDADTEIHFKETKSGVSVKQGKDKINIRAGGDEKDFPNVRRIHNDHEFKMKASLLKKVLKLVEPFVPLHCDNSRFTLDGLFMEIDDNKLTLAATDSKRLAEAVVEIDYDWGGEPQGFIIPKKALEVLSVWITSKKEEEVTLRFNEYQFEAECDNTIVNANLVNGVYPPYRKVFVPSDEDTFLKVNREALANAVKRSKTMVEEGNDKIRFAMEGQSLRISSTSFLDGDVDLNLDVSYSGEEAKIIGFYTSDWDKILKLLKAEELEIRFREESFASLSEIIEEDIAYRYITLCVTVDPT